MRLSLFVLVVGIALVSSDWGPYGENCQIGKAALYDPSQQFDVPWFTVNLDEAPEERWRHVAASHGAQITAALATVRRLLGIIGDGIIWDVLTSLMETAVDRVPGEYKQELHGLSAYSGVPLSHLTLLNLFYEISKGCTSIVAEDPNGKIYHARNQDFGTFFVWNQTIRTWEQTEALKNLLINVNFVKNGRLLFKGVTFAGHLGVLTGLRPHGWTLSTNARFGNAFSNMLAFFRHGALGREFLMYADRDAMTQCATYDEAVHFLSNLPLFASGYFIVGGRKSGEGAVITRGPNGTDHVQYLNPSTRDGWYLLQTNYDWNKTVIFLDDRRGPGRDCMGKLGKENVGHQGLYQVLSSPPNLNKATVYTSVMQVEEVRLESYIRYCADPCWFV